MELATKRLLLRPLRNDDAPAMTHSLNNLCVSRNLARVKFPYELADAQAYIAWQRGQPLGTTTCAIAFRCAPDELIGMISYETAPGEEGARFGYWLRQCCWHMGLMSEAAAALVDHAFAHGDVSALHADFHNDNPNSSRLLQALGFVEIRQALSFSLAQQAEVPSTQLRLTREAWLDQQKSRAA